MGPRPVPGQADDPQWLDYQMEITKKCFEAMTELNTRLRETRFALGGDMNSFDVRIWLAVYQSDVTVFGNLFDESPSVHELPLIVAK